MNGSYGGSSNAQAIIDSIAGYAVYFDTQYTDVAPLNVASGSTVTLPNNAGNIIDQLPTGVTSFYDNVLGKITPDTELDRLTITVRLLAKTTVTQGASLNFGIDIGGSFGIIFPDDRLFIKGSNTEQAFNFVMPGYSGATFLANGGTPKITSIGGVASIYNIELHIERTYKGK